MSAKSTLAEIASVLRGAERVAILSHSRPDGDTLGSNLGLGAALRALGKTVSNLCEDEIPAKFCYLTGFSEFNRPQSEDFDAVVCVDCGDRLRLGAKDPIFASCPETINIDHHISNDCYAKYNFVKYYASSCEIIFELVPLLGVEWNEQIATCLYTGISTDTGNFMHANTDTHALLAAAELKKYVPDVSVLTNILYKEMPKERLLLLSKALPTVRFFLGDRLAIMSVRHQAVEESGAETSYTEGFVDYTVNVKGVDVGVCLLESGHNVFKVSFRSKGTDVCAIAERFGGGGHKCAAGCRVFGFFEDVVDKIVREVSIAFEAEAQKTRS